jgi:hypothetical protein
MQAALIKATFQQEKRKGYAGSKKSLPTMQAARIKSCITEVTEATDKAISQKCDC